MGLYKEAGLKTEAAMFLHCWVFLGGDEALSVPVPTVSKYVDYS